MSNNLYWNLAVIGDENIFNYLKKKNKLWGIEILNCSSVGDFVRIRHTRGYSQGRGQYVILKQYLQSNEDKDGIRKHLEYVEKQRRIGILHNDEGLVLDLAGNDFLNETGLVRRFEQEIERSELFNFLDRFVQEFKPRK